MDQKNKFLQAVNQLQRADHTSIYTKQDIADKISILRAAKPTRQSNEYWKWNRANKRFIIVSYQTSKILFLRGKCNEVNRRVLPIEDIYETIERLHIELDHCGRTGLYKRISQEFHGITEKICHMFISHCELCQLKKYKKPLKSLVIKPISSSVYLSRGQVDLIDLSTTFPENNLPYKWLLVYQDHFTKFVRLCPLKTKSAEELACTLMDILLDMGAPFILQSDNGREFKNDLLFRLLNERWTTTKIIHGKPRHPESQGSVERANQDIKRHFTAMLFENNSNSWSHYVKLVQYRKNTSYHSTLGMTPFQALFNLKPPIGLSELGIPDEAAHTIASEEYLARVSVRLLVHNTILQ